MNIYLDNAATTPVDPLVTKAMFEWQNENFGNPSSPHKHGQVSKIKMEQVRDEIASRLGCLSKEIVFTSGGTESNNKAIIGCALANSSKGKHIIVSGAEHPSVLSASEHLQNMGFEISCLNPEIDGSMNLTKLEETIRNDTILISLMYVNNETGVIFPVSKISKICLDKNILFHCDAVQAFGKINIDIKDLEADLFSFSAHKIHGPKGVGGLFIKSGTAVDDLAFGGGQEANRRAGTENLTGVIGMGKATELMDRHLDDWQKVMLLNNSFESMLSEKVTDIIVIGKKTDRSPYISNISFLNTDNQSLLLKLDLSGISVSVGSACSSGSIKQSQVLQAMHLPEEIITSSIRFSFSRFNTIEEIEKSVEIIKKEVEKLRKK